MKWLFSRGEKQKIDVQLTNEELADIAWTLKEVAGQAMFGSASLVVSPGSRESISYLNELAGLNERFDEEQATPKSLRKLRETLQEVQIHFGEWQRGQTQQTISEFANSLNSLMACVESSLGDQAESSTTLNQMQQRLTEARTCNDLTKVREMLRKEVEAARELISKQAASQKLMRDRFTKAFEEMQSRIAKAESAAQTDHLTSMGNRAAFDFHLETALQKAKAGNGPYSVAVFDLDEFKPINDKYGHAVGDQVLVAFAERLKQAFPSPAFVGRFGGDEFAVIACMNPVEIKRRTQRAQQDFEAEPLSFQQDGLRRQIRIHFSFGCVEIQPSDTSALALARADQAMYEHKQQRKAERAA